MSELESLDAALPVIALDDPIFLAFVRENPSFFPQILQDQCALNPVPPLTPE